MDARFHYYGNPVGAKFQRAIGAAGKAVNDSTLPDATKFGAPGKPRAATFTGGSGPLPQHLGACNPRGLSSAMHDRAAQARGSLDYPIGAPTCRRTIGEFRLSSSILYLRT